MPDFSILKDPPKKPPYDRIALLNGIRDIDQNIAVLKESIRKEEKRREEFEGYLRAWEEYDEKTRKRK